MTKQQFNLIMNSIDRLEETYLSDRRSNKFFNLRLDYTKILRISLSILCLSIAYKILTF